MATELTVSDMKEPYRRKRTALWITAVLSAGLLALIATPQVAESAPARSARHQSQPHATKRATPKPATAKHVTAKRAPKIAHVEAPPADVAAPEPEATPPPRPHPVAQVVDSENPPMR